MNLDRHKGPQTKLCLFAFFIGRAGTHRHDAGKNHHQEESGSYKEIMHGGRSLFCR